MLRQTILSSEEASFELVNVYGYFGNSEKSVKNNRECCPLFKCTDIKGASKTRFVREDGKAFAYFLPVCAERNMEAREAFRNGKVVSCGGRNFVMGYADEIDRMEFPDFLNGKCEVV